MLSFIRATIVGKSVEILKWHVSVEGFSGNGHFSLLLTFVSRKSLERTFFDESWDLLRWLVAAQIHMKWNEGETERFWGKIHMK